MKKFDGFDLMWKLMVVVVFYFVGIRHLIMMIEGDALRDIAILFSGASLMILLDVITTKHKKRQHVG